MKLDRRGHVYDMLEGAYLGLGSDLDVVLVNDTLRQLAVLPYRVRGVSLAVAAPRYRPGRKVQIAIALDADARPWARHVVHVDVIAPDGVVRREYSRDVRTTDGKGSHTIPLALNDAEGVWSITATDAITGAQATTTFEVRP